MFFREPDRAGSNKHISKLPMLTILIGLDILSLCQVTSLPSVHCLKMPIRPRSPTERQQASTTRCSNLERFISTKETAPTGRRTPILRLQTPKQVIDLVNLFLFLVAAWLLALIWRIPVKRALPTENLQVLIIAVLTRGLFMSSTNALTQDRKDKQ